MIPDPLWMRSVLGDFLAGCGLLILSGSLSGCGKLAWPEHDSNILIDPIASELEFWPPTGGYLRRGETALLSLKGLQRVYTCTRLLQLHAEFRPTSGDSQTLQIHTTLELPSNASCPLDQDGLDTTLSVNISQTVGIRIFLQNGGSISQKADTVVAGVSTLDSLDFLTDSTRTARSGKFQFLDSGATRTKRLLVSDSMVQCETFEGAVYERFGSSYRVRFRRLILDPLLHPTFPPCMGMHSDTLVVVRDQYGYSTRP